MASRPERLITYDDCVTFPDEPRLEVIRGEAHVVPSPNTRHQEVVGDLFAQIHAHLKSHGGGRVFVAPFDVVLTDTDIVQPDIVFIADDRLDALTDANVRGAPSWVIEILSPSEPSRDLKLKLNAYERAGVPEYWIVDPDQQTVTVHSPAGDVYARPIVFGNGDVLRPNELLDLALPVDGVFVGR